jgi:aryl-alcohol dehydrogenase-like predicted oxidoreductase
MFSRRQLLKHSSLLAASGLLPAVAWAGSGIRQRVIPATGATLPVIGLGTSGNFEVGDSAAETDPLREVLKRFFASGARLIDTAPSYGRAELVLGSLLAESGQRPHCFLASKLSSVGREAGLAQFSESLRRLRTDRMDLLQVHNLRDWRTQLAVARELKSEGRIDYIGVTHYVDSAHADMAEVIASEKLDFMQINYSVASPAAAKRLLPLAADRGVAVIVNRAFEDGHLFTRVQGRALPAWAESVGVGSWAQMFLRFAISHPAVTVVIPATSRPDRQSDNLRAGYGPDLDKAQCAELIAMFG